MLRLRPYKDCDAEAIVSWIGGERAFRQWCADRYDSYPVTADDLIDHYRGTACSDAFFPMTAFDEKGAAGHLILRFTDEEKSVVRLGFVIVDSSRRGTGLGKELVKLAVRYAFEFLGAKKVTLGVFENNAPALHCYLAAGFRTVEADEQESYRIFGEEWKCTELETDSPL